MDLRIPAVTNLSQDVKINLIRVAADITVAFHAGFERERLPEETFGPVLKAVHEAYLNSMPLTLPPKS